MQSFYQRILSSDPDEVAFQAEALLATLSLQAYYEEVALPALAMAQVDVTRGVLEKSRQVEVCDCVEQVVADLSDHVDVEGTETEVPAVGEPLVAPGSSDQNAVASGVVLCVAGRTPLDRAACAILAQLLERKGVSTRIADPEALSIGLFGLDASGVRAICVLYLDHRSLAAVRYAVRRLRKKFSDTPVAVCLWGATNLASAADASRADATLGTLGDAVDFVSAREGQSARGRSARRAGGVRRGSRT